MIDGITGIKTAPDIISVNPQSTAQTSSTESIFSQKAQIQKEIDSALLRGDFSRIAQLRQALCKIELEEMTNKYKKPTLPQAEKPFDTKLILGGIVASDFDRSKSVSKEELETSLQRTQGKLQTIEYFKQMFPFFSSIYDNMIKQCNEELNTLTLIKNNFDTFSSKKVNSGSTEYITYEIQQADLDKIIKSAQKDTNISDFSKTDLADLKSTKKIPNAPYAINSKEGARVNEFYNTILDRNCEVDSDESGWTKQLKSGIPEQQVIKGFFNSAEYLKKKETAQQTVTRLYQSILGREPEKGGLDYWSGLITKGQSVNFVIDQIYNSAEYKAKIQKEQK